MNSPWPVRKLRDVAEIRISNVDKKVYPNEKPVKLCNYMDAYTHDYITGGIPFMEGSATSAEIERFGLRGGDVIITKDSETPDDIGIPAVVIEEIPGLVCGYHLALIRPDSEQVDSIYLAKQLSTSSVARYFSLHASGSTRYGLPVSAIEAVEIPMPPTAEQAKIAEILSTVDRAIEQMEALIAKQQRIKTGLMQDLLTRGIDEHGNLRSGKTHKFKDSPLGRIPVEWEVQSLADTIGRNGGKIQTGPFGSQLHSHEYVAEGIPVIMPQDITENGINKLQISRITHQKAGSLARHRVKAGDLVFARRGDLSRCAVIGEEEQGWLCGTGCLLMTPPAKAISSNWLAETYRSHSSQLQIAIRAVGSTMPNLNTRIFQDIKIALPPLEEQISIESRFKALATYGIGVQNRLEKLRMIKNALMRSLLTGTKRVAWFSGDVQIATARAENERGGR